MTPDLSTTRNRAVAAAVAFVVLGAAAFGYVRFTADREGDKARAAATDSGLPELADASPAPAGTGVGGTAPTPTTATPAMFTINRSPGDRYGMVARIGSDGTVAPLGDFRCERVHTGGDTGVCLVPSPEQIAGALTLGLESGELIIFDANTGAVRTRHPVAGRPSRLRVSADGRYAGYTAFVTGHSYAVASTLFSTNPVIVDTLSGVHRNIENFLFTDESGRLIDDPTRNFWGISFAPDDSDTFYAALGIGDTNWIVRGSVSGQNGEVIAEGLMCPSASPDGRHLVARAQGSESRYTIVDLETGERHLLAEQEIVDDQAEWIDDHTVAYAILRPDSPANQPVYDLWTLNVDSGERTQLAEAASSPATLRSA
jgi:hypothetical protein